MAPIDRSITTYYWFAIVSIHVALYVHKLLIKHTSDMVFSLYIILHGWTDFCVFSCVLFCSFLIIVFLCLCFYAFVLFCALLVILSLLLVIMGGQHDGLFLSGSPPVLYIYIHMYIFLMANKLCCCCCCYLLLFSSSGMLKNIVTLRWLKVMRNGTIRKLTTVFYSHSIATMVTSLAVSAQYTNVTDRHHPDTAWQQGRAFLCIASRGKKR